MLILYYSKNVLVLMLGVYLVQMLLHNLLSYSKLLSQTVFTRLFNVFFLNLILIMKLIVDLFLKLNGDLFSDLASAVFLSRRAGYHIFPYAICQSSMFFLMILAASLLLLV